MIDDAIRIRKAGRLDLPDILGLYAQPDLDDGNVLSFQAAECIFLRFSNYPEYSLYVAERNGRVVGSFALLIMENLAHLGAPSAIVEDVAVDATLHGQGIGRAMMDFAADEARKKRCYKLMLSSNAKRERAHAFYESLNFERHGYSFRLALEEVCA